MNIAQQFREEGKIEGLIEAQKKIARRLLQSGGDVKAVARVTDLPVEIVQAIANDLEQVQH
ncbi:MAG: hypothetical protein WBE18_06610 [Gammaproteobacteria bacterium]